MPTDERRQGHPFALGIRASKGCSTTTARSAIASGCDFADRPKAAFHDVAPKAGVRRPPPTSRDHCPLPALMQFDDVAIGVPHKYRARSRLESHRATASANTGGA